jgi:hypothetical protein
MMTDDNKIINLLDIFLIECKDLNTEGGIRNRLFEKYSLLGLVFLLSLNLTSQEKN